MTGDYEHTDILCNETEVVEIGLPRRGQLFKGHKGKVLRARKDYRSRSAEILRRKARRQ